MNKFKSAFFTFVLPAIAVFVVAYFYNLGNNSDMHLCKHQFALCTSALCIPQPTDPTKAICFCEVEEGASMSTTACDSIKPSTDSKGIRTVYSTFSLKQFQEGKKGMKCPAGTPWTWCLNKRCTVDPSNPKKAICVCDVMRSGEWMTLGGNCDTSTCATGYWSGATVKESEAANTFLTKMLGLDESAMKWCQAVSP